MKRFALALLVTLCAAPSAWSQPASDAAPAARTYIYVLRLVPRLYDAANWTDADMDIVRRHFVRLQRLTADGTVVLAGKTDNEDADGFGIVIFEASSPEEARRLMEEDPGVAEGIMTGAVFPYTIALQRAPAD